MATLPTGFLITGPQVLVINIQGSSLAFVFFLPDPPAAENLNTEASILNDTCRISRLK